MEADKISKTKLKQNPLFPSFYEYPVTPFTGDRSLLSLNARIPKRALTGADHAQDIDL